MTRNLIKQISVFAENKPGRISRISHILSEADVNIRAFTIAEANEFGIIRMVLDNPEKAGKILRHKGFTVTETEVIGVEMRDTPGGLGEIVNVLGKNNINIEYAYAFTTKTGKALLILRVDQNEPAIQSLQANGVKIVDMAEVEDL